MWHITIPFLELCERTGKNNKVCSKMRFRTHKTAATDFFRLPLSFATVYALLNVCVLFSLFVHDCSKMPHFIDCQHLTSLS